MTSIVYYSEMRSVDRLWRSQQSLSLYIYMCVCVCEKGGAMNASNYYLYGAIACYIEMAEGPLIIICMEL